MYILLSGVQHVTVLLKMLFQPPVINAWYEKNNIKILFIVVNLSNFLNVKIELDKTAEEFRKAHSERQELLRQWENTIEQMQKRDREMDQLAVVSIFPTSCDHRGSCVNYIM